MKIKVMTSKKIDLQNQNAAKATFTNCLVAAVLILAMGLTACKSTVTKPVEAPSAKDVEIYGKVQELVKENQTAKAIEVLQKYNSEAGLTKKLELLLDRLYLRYGGELVSLDKLAAAQECLKKIPKDSACYPKAKMQLRAINQKITARTKSAKVEKQRNQQSNKQKMQALKALRSIPPSSPLYKDAQKSIRELLRKK